MVTIYLLIGTSIKGDLREVALFPRSDFVVGLSDYVRLQFFSLTRNFARQI